ncbi:MULTISPECIES: alpha/beta hydrolase [Asticcacaulis]|uniref:alpha/beta hydrolase n=1 Tax=Asticcacaulis TaxID=76890 RepID=UPI001AEA7DE4|nr:MULTISPECIES: alpha/beta hydrolase [Asticcacaulis]MBP2161409.1 acetyl esterase [Asticcacaulis solisilvae]MDR6802454.1 acetyl esterase [Asticcacaulis sp. BE141]
MRSSLLRQRLLKTVLTLPPAMLRFLSGGGVVYQDGRTLDPQIQFLWHGYFAKGDATPLTLHGKTLEQARQEWAETAALLGLPSQVRVKVEDISSETVRGLLVRPSTISADAPLLVFFPQGAGVLGGPGLSRAVCAALAHEARCPIFIPELRLAPVHRFPAALDDARDALNWAQANAGRLGTRNGGTAIGGILTGANLAARLCIDLKREFKPLPMAQLLITPLVDLSDPRLKDHVADGWPFAGDDIHTLASHYAGAGTDLTDPRISPALEKLLIGQPRTLAVSAGLDPLAAQTEAFVRRLIAARVNVVYRRYDTLPLGFDLLTGVVDTSYAAVQDIARLWVELLRAGHPEGVEAPEAMQDIA